MMKITNTPPIRPTDPKRRTGSSAKTGTNFESFLNIGDAEAPKDVAEAQEASNFLFLQEVSDEEVRRQKALQQGRQGIQALEQLHRDLLMGRVPVATLKRLESSIPRQRESFTDPRLKQLLDEIELRAAVELAKLERAGKYV